MVWSLGLKDGTLGPIMECHNDFWKEINLSQDVGSASASPSSYHREVFEVGDL